MEQFLTENDVKAIVKKNHKKKEALITILLEIQEASGKNYISEQCANVVAKELNIPISRVYDVVTFYAMFSTKPRGKHVIELCKSATCHVTDSKAIVKLFEEILGIKVGETTEDGMFTLQYTSCFGGCDVAPAIKIGEIIYGNLNKNRIEEILNSYREGSICQNS